MDDFIGAEDFAAASALAEDLLRQTEAEFGPESEMLADTHLKVAAVESRNREFEAAEQNALRAIDIYQSVGGPYYERLIEPYVVLGDNYQANSDYVSALSSYNEARTISRRVFGLLNEGQIEIIDRMTESAMGLNQFEEAANMQREALTLVERTHEPQSPEALEAVYKYAAWLRRNNQFTSERMQYARADRIIREHYGDESLLLVRPLRERANSWRVQGYEENIGISGLRNALELLENHPEPLMTAEVYRDLGDWDVAFSKLASDGSAYLVAWDLLGEIENGDEIREEWFEPMTPVIRAPLSLRGLTMDPNAPTGNVIVRFTVDTTGRTSDIVIVESNPPGLKDDAVTRQIRQSRFRPMIRDGQLIRARRAYNIEFHYEVDD
jgi:TonB family protein